MKVGEISGNVQERRLKCYGHVVRGKEHYNRREMGMGVQGGRGRIFFGAVSMYSTCMALLRVSLFYHFLKAIKGQSISGTMLLRIQASENRLIGDILVYTYI